MTRPVVTAMRRKMQRPSQFSRLTLLRDMRWSMHGVGVCGSDPKRYLDTVRTCDMVVYPTKTYGSTGLHHHRGDATIDRIDELEAFVNGVSFPPSLGGISRRCDWTLAWDSTREKVQHLQWRLHRVECKRQSSSTGLNHSPKVDLSRQSPWF